MSRESTQQLLERGYRYALALTHDVSQAEDLLHDAWLAIHKRSRRAPVPVGYLLTTIRNRFIDGRRKAARFPLEPLDLTSSGDGVEAAFFDPATVDTLALDQALAELRSEEREFIYLTAVEGYTVRETAELTGRPIGTVSSLVQRARTKLRRMLSGSGAVRSARRTLP